jgi:hypothetical protein
MEKNDNGFSLKVILAWLFVGLPLIWGISQTILKSMALFN